MLNFSFSNNMRMRSLKYISILIIFSVTSCDEAETVPQEDPIEPVLPVVSTGEVTDLSEHTATFTGSVNIGTYKLLLNGFILSEAADSEDSTIILTDTKPVFDTTVTDLVRGNTYYIRAFAKAYSESDKTTPVYFFGDQVSFTTLNPPIEFIDFWPKTGKPGDIITIAASNLEPDHDLFEVRFGDVKAHTTPTTSISSQFTVIVPDLEGYAYKITLSYNGGIPTESEEYFTIPRGSWTQLGNGPSDEQLKFSFTIGDTAYASFGDNELFYAYHPASGTWKQKTSFPDDTEDLVIIGAFSVASSGYVINQKKFYRYNPYFNDWEQLSDFPGNTRRAPVSFSMNNKGYVGLGYDNGGLMDFWEYDPMEETWTQKNDFPGAVSGNSYTLADDTHAFLYTGGRFWIYEGATDTWSQKDDFPLGALEWPRGFVLDGKSYWVAGQLCYFFDNDLEIWVPVNYVPHYKWQPLGFSVNGKGYICAGSTFSCWRFNP